MRQVRAVKEISTGLESGNLPVYSRWAYFGRKCSGVFLPRCGSVTEHGLRLRVTHKFLIPQRYVVMKSISKGTVAANCG
jgi:hypothetical protein